MSKDELDLHRVELASIAGELRDVAIRLATALERQAGISDSVASISSEEPSDEVPGPVSPGDEATMPLVEMADPPLDGRWSGEMPNGAFALRLRLDRDGSGKVSGDLANAGASGFEWDISFSTTPGDQVYHGTSHWQVWFDMGGDLVGEGELAVAWVSADEASASLAFSRPPPGYPADTALYFPIKRESDALRRVRLRAISDSQSQKKATARSLTESFMNKLGEAGIECVLDEQRGWLEGTSAERGWGQIEILDAALSQSLKYTQGAGNEPAGPPDLELDLVVGGRPARNALTAFSLEPNPAIRRRVIVTFCDNQTGLDAAVRQALHQFGASCGLVPHKDPRINIHFPQSPMAEAMELPEKQDSENTNGSSVGLWGFETRELAHLRHAGIATLAMGLHGTAEPYWMGRTVQPLPPTFIGAKRSLRLELELPATGPVFELGQPVFLTLRLTNLDQEAIILDEDLLDPKKNVLKITLMRLGWAPVQAVARFVRPALRRRVQSKIRQVKPGNFIETNIQVGFGRDGWLLAEPGVYSVSAFLDLPFGDYASRIEATPVRVRVREPRSFQGEREALDLLNPETGLYFALGGTRLLSGVADRLNEISMERAGRKELDGVVAASWRALAIDAGRAYPNLSAAEREQSLIKAVDFIKRLGPDLLNHFDEKTRADIIALAKTQEARLAAMGGPPRKSRTKPPRNRRNKT